MSKFFEKKYTTRNEKGGKGTTRKGKRYSKGEKKKEKRKRKRKLIEEENEGGI